MVFMITYMCLPKSGKLVVMYLCIRGIEFDLFLIFLLYFAWNCSDNGATVVVIVL
jgi:hypothetical protein